MWCGSLDHPRDLFAGLTDISVRILPIGSVLPPLFDDERSLLSGMVPARRREFAWGRAAAREAMERLGQAAAPLLPDADRVPVWPRGLSGSITHSGPICGAAVTSRAGSIGFDIEMSPLIEPDFWDELFTETEIMAFVSQSPRAVVHFSAKEAVFKAHFPVYREMFDFKDLRISLAEDGTFRADFTRHHGPAFAPVEGRWIQTPAYTATGVVLAPMTRWH